MNAEQAMLSAILRQADMTTPLSQGVTADWFSTYQTEWQWVELYHSRHRRVPSKSTFKVQFPQFRIVAVDDADFAVEELRVAYAKRLMLLMADDVIADLERGKDVNNIVAGAQKALVGMQASLDGGRYQSDILKDWKGTYASAWMRTRLAKTSGASGIPTGWPELDAATGGYHPGEYWVYAARLGQGKTWALIRTAIAAMMAGKTVQFHGLEQSRTQLAMRFHTFLSKLLGPQVFRASDLTRGLTYAPIDYKRFLTGLQDLVPGRLILDDTPRGKLTTLALAAQVERNQPQMLIIDYLTLMSTSSDWQAVGELSSDIKGMTADYNISTIVASQTNRNALLNKDSGPEHLSKSDAIGQDADGVVMLHKESRHVMRMKLAKYRHGEDLSVWWNHFDPNNGTFEEVSRDDAEKIKDDDAMLDDQ